MYKRAPTVKELAALGLKPEDYAEEDNEVIEVWPENQPVYDLWGVIGDQWRMGPAGAVAIDLMPVFHELDRMSLDRESYNDLLTGIKTIASVALDEMHKDF